MKKIISFILTLCLTFCLSNSAFAMDTQFDEDFTYGVITDVDLVESYDSTITPRGGTPPSSNSVWDLSSEDYYGSFDFDNLIYTNNRFENHNGNLYVYVNSYFTETWGRDTTGFTMDVSLVKMTVLGNKYISTVEIEVGRPYVVYWEGVDDNEDYYFIFSQPYNHRDCRIGGNFRISATNHWF